MHEKISFTLGNPDSKKHSTKFSTLSVESNEGTPAGFDPSSFVATFYIPKPFGETAKKIQVTLETID